MYLWAGPSLVRMTRLKFFNPRIDVESVMGSYEHDYLARAKEIFGLTDVWVMYSFGFSEETEREDHEFLLARLGNFKKLGLKVHAYLQGTNLVYEDFRGRDWFCMDEQGRLVPYYRGRKVVCLNNPGFCEYILKKARKMASIGFDGVYVDNIMAGQMPMTVYRRGVPVVFAGCRCRYCLDKFERQAGEVIPRDMERNVVKTKKYLELREEWTHEFIGKLSKIVRRKGIEFGTNSFDPVHIKTGQVFGFDVQKLARLQDYVMIENHTLPTEGWKKNNGHVNELAKKLEVPVFCVSYRRGIGFDGQFSQADFDRVFSEAKYYCPCVKGTEYVTQGVWHNLRLEKLKKVRKNVRVRNGEATRRAWFGGLLERMIKFPTGKRLLKRHYNEFLTFYMENKWMRKFYNVFYPYVVSRG